MQFQIENESSEYFKGGVVALKEEHFARLALDSRTLRRLWLAVRYSLFAVRCSLFAAFSNVMQATKCVSLELQPHHGVQ
jgi:hypothetical protein